VRNEASALRKVLRALAAQQPKPAEILVVDNASSDDTRQVAEQGGAKVFNLPCGEFTYGRALNLGIREATGEFICILSAHSLPIGPDFLRNAAAPLANARIAAVRCLSVTNRGELERWMTDTILEWPVEIEKVISCAPMNAAALIRRSVWEEIPYDETLAGVEDKFWAWEVLQRGYCISTSAAPFVYIVDRGYRDQLRKLTRDREEFFRITGRQWQEPVVSFSRLMQTIFYHIPRRAVRNAIFETALYANLKTIPYRAARKVKTS